MIGIVRKLAPLPAVLLAMLAGRRAGVPIEAFLPNLTAIAIGVVALWIFERRGFRLATTNRVVLMAAAFVALLVMASTFLFEGLDGVHRWIWLGPVSLNVGVLLTPFLTVSFDRLVRVSRLAAFALLSTAFALFSLQPDAGQALILATSLVALAIVADDISPRPRIAWSSIALALAALCFLRPDDLEPVAHVEKILPMIVSQGVVISIALGLAVMTLVAPFWLRRTSEPERRYAIFATTYFVTAIAVTFVGNFPTPVFGAGLAGTLSWYLLLALRP